MAIQIDVNGTDAQGRVFLTWAPVQATIRWTGASGAAMQDVILSSTGAAAGLVFDTLRSDRGQGTLALTLPTDGTPVSFWIAGEFQRPSVAYGDAMIEVADAATGAVLSTTPAMVRIRKNGQTLSPAERDRYLLALGSLNAKGQGAYRDFRDIHTAVADREMHGNVGFLPWHRAYVLDLERALQAIDPTVTVPYWRFDQAAPAILDRDFMGESGPAGRVLFRPGHPLDSWMTDGQSGITRGLRFPINNPANVISESQTMALGGPSSDYGGFDRMEGNPHGSAHVSFDGPINFPPTAVRDPLFFMLHCNIDRLWAKWQWVNRRDDPADPRAYAPPSPNRIGHHLGDTMWPWNGVTGGVRPPTAPGGPFPGTPMTAAPGPTPKVESVFDHLATVAGDPLGFAYDDVPFELPVAVVAGGP
ncbi:tyrosinase family protein [Beijerinckia sp. L45]|uniref:tyrosinase family protein n=1 Tax=Beijerinckia sp. L45 TaxID=1641855 RepID=UPI00131C00FF|nr:tyrosinase family protein [Beijerinckia sp. L45]